MWISNISAKFSSQFQNLTERGEKIIGTLPEPAPRACPPVFQESVIKKSLKISEDINHILYKEYESMPTGKKTQNPELIGYKFSLGDDEIVCVLPDITCYLLYLVFVQEKCHPRQ